MALSPAVAQITIRNLIVALITLSVVFAAGYINYASSATCNLEDTDIPFKEIIAVGNFRTTVHVFIFIVVGFLVGPWGKGNSIGSRKLSWMYVLLGGTAIEIAQSVWGCERSTLEWLDAFVDIGMDLLGGWLGIMVAIRYQEWRTRSERVSN